MGWAPGSGGVHASFLAEDRPDEVSLAKVNELVQDRPSLLYVVATLSPYLFRLFWFRSSHAPVMQCLLDILYLQHRNLGREGPAWVQKLRPKEQMALLFSEPEWELPKFLLQSLVSWRRKLHVLTQLYRIGRYSVFQRPPFRSEILQALKEVKEGEPLPFLVFALFQTPEGDPSHLCPSSECIFLSLSLSMSSKDFPQVPLHVPLDKLMDDPRTRIATYEDAFLAMLLPVFIEKHEWDEALWEERKYVSTSCEMQCQAAIAEEVLDRLVSFERDLKEDVWSSLDDGGEDNRDISSSHVQAASFSRERKKRRKDKREKEKEKEKGRGKGNRKKRQREEDVSHLFTRLREDEDRNRFLPTRDAFSSFEPIPIGVRYDGSAIYASPSRTHPAASLYRSSHLLEKRHPAVHRRRTYMFAPLQGGERTFENAAASSSLLSSSPSTGRLSESDHARRVLKKREKQRSHRSNRTTDRTSSLTHDEYRQASPRCTHPCSYSEVRNEKNPHYGQERETWISPQRRWKDIPSDDLVDEDHRSEKAVSDAWDAWDIWDVWE
uniref:Uncharacterized protein n=1 Tax=Palpitomonas bilix TaxID=652834 RepID=A0A7S3DC58_9EUKA|mmetsp:Transcript_30755/g.80453  ORF Transcript_30755/g.80453 Transcript_30755/m.80453 type:complete len:550 (+) Transcript_30755:703-2352(+)